MSIHSYSSLSFSPATNSPRPRIHASTAKRVACTAQDPENKGKSCEEERTNGHTTANHRVAPKEGGIEQNRVRHGDHGPSDGAEQPGDGVGRAGHGTNRRTSPEGDRRRGGGEENTKRKANYSASVSRKASVLARNAWNAVRDDTRNCLKEGRK